MTPYPEDFLKAVDDLIDNWEGTTFTNTKGDAGHGTKFGISSTSYPHVDIPNLTREGAEAIYFRDFWNYPGMDSIVDAAFRAKVFNMAVLMGQGTALHLYHASSSIEDYRQICKRHYDAIVASHPEDVKFQHGWDRRAMA